MLSEMPVPDDTVVPAIAPLMEDKFHDAMMEAISRQTSRHGKGAVAQALGVSIKQVGNLAAGSFPRPDRLFNLLAQDEDALDPIDRQYGGRRVPRDAVCSSDPISARLAHLLSQTIVAERPDSDGGAAVKLSEIMAFDEDVLRHCALRFAGWVEMIDAYRAGEAPRLRAVAS